MAAGVKVSGFGGAGGPGKWPAGKRPALAKQSTNTVDPVSIAASPNPVPRSLQIRSTSCFPQLKEAKAAQEHLEEVLALAKLKATSEQLQQLDAVTAAAKNQVLRKIEGNRR